MSGLGADPRVVEWSGSCDMGPGQEGLMDNGDNGKGNEGEWQREQENAHGGQKAKGTAMEQGMEKGMERSKA